MPCCQHRRETGSRQYPTATPSASTGAQVQEPAALLAITSRRVSEVPISRAIKKLDNGGHDVNGLLGAALSRARACAKSCQFSSVELQRFVERALFPLPLRFATDRLRVTDVTGFVLSSVV